MGIRLELLFCKGLALGLAACQRKPSSRIVKKLEEAGAGDLRTATVGSLVQWLEKHPAVAMEVDDLCSHARAHGRASWPQTTEGRVCNAASHVAEFFKRPREIEAKNDHQAFQGGSR
jgi:hypothetical protein